MDMLCIYYDYNLNAYFCLRYLIKNLVEKYYY